MEIHKYTSATDSLRALTNALITQLEQRSTNPFHLALPGGETARQLYALWASEYRQLISWDVLRFYWVDERCVSPDDNESNFKHANNLLFVPLNIPTAHIHRIFGEHVPETEAQRYSEMIKWELPGYSKLPRFDCIILGIGRDGHAASIFGNSSPLLTDNHPYVVAHHPVTRQPRITMTAPIILHSKSILVPVNGEPKQEIMEKIAENKGKFPALEILQQADQAIVFTDRNIRP